MIMAWVAVDNSGNEYIFDVKPVRFGAAWDTRHMDEQLIVLPNGSIKKLIGRELTWEDEPVELE